MIIDGNYINEYYMAKLLIKVQNKGKIYIDT